MPTKVYNNCFNIQNRDGIRRRPCKSSHQIAYIKSCRSRILRMVAFHLSEQVFMIIKNEEIRYIMTIVCFTKTGCTFYFFFSLSFLFSLEFIPEIRPSNLHPELTFIKFVSWLNVVNVRKSSWIQM